MSRKIKIILITVLCITATAAITIMLLTSSISLTPGAEFHYVMTDHEYERTKAEIHLACKANKDKLIQRIKDAYDPNDLTAASFDIDYINNIKFSAQEITVDTESEHPVVIITYDIKKAEYSSIDKLSADIRYCKLHCQQIKTGALYCDDADILTEYINRYYITERYQEMMITPIGDGLYYFISWDTDTMPVNTVSVK